jgi:hypothetical protein
MNTDVTDNDTGINPTPELTGMDRMFRMKIRNLIVG